GLHSRLLAPPAALGCGKQGTDTDARPPKATTGNWRRDPYLRAHSERSSPAMAAGVTDHVWTVEELVGLLG
ncbi:MAG: hypothetical protein WA976_06990, partial [Candidatus Dormiibacterota bacterium]